MMIEIQYIYETEYYRNKHYRNRHKRTRGDYP